MSGYDAGGGSRPGERRGGRPHMTKEQYDSRQARKPVSRKTIDYLAPLVLHDSIRYRIRDWRDQSALQATSDSIREMDAVIDAANHNPSLGLCTRYVGMAVNKVRAPITAMSWFPEGRRLLTGAHSGEMTQWSGHQFNFEGIVAAAHDEPIRAMQWSHSGQLLLTADEGGVIKYWQHTLNNLKAFKAHPEPVRDLTFSPSDSHFATCSDDQTCSIWDTETQAELLCLKGHGYDVKCIKWHPSKGLLASGSKDALIKLWDPRVGSGGGNNGKNAHCLADLHFHKNTVNRLAWSPLNPHWLASGSRDNLVKLYDLRTMKDFQTGRHAQIKDSKANKEVTALTWHPSIERLFASGSNDGTIHKWLVGQTGGGETGEQSVAEITGAHDSAVFGLEWHPLGHLLASASNDHTTRFWARNRPGDDMTDKYNVSQLPDAAKVEAVRMLAEGVMKNPSKYSRLHASLAEFAETNPETTNAARVGGAAAPEFIPGMGGVPASVTTSVATSSKTDSKANLSHALPLPHSSPSLYAPPPPPPSSFSSHDAHAYVKPERHNDRDSQRSSHRDSRHSSRHSRSRSRERDHSRTASSRSQSHAPSVEGHKFFTGAAQPSYPPPTQYSYPPPPPSQASYVHHGQQGYTQNNGPPQSVYEEPSAVQMHYAQPPQPSYPPQAQQQAGYGYPLPPRY